MSKYNVYVENVSMEAIINKLGGIEGARAFLRGEKKLVPVSFERNEHGHIVLTITGLGLTGKQEIERLEAAGFRIGGWARSCLLSKEKDGYDKKHRLLAGQEYKIALMPTKEIECGSNRTTGNLRRRGFEHYGYEKPLAGIMPRIREMISDEHMEDMGLWYIASSHDTIKDPNSCDPRILFAYRDDGGLWLYAGRGRHINHWSDRGAFAFFDPES